MKFLVLGAAGMAGHTIAIYLTEQGHDVLGFDLVKVDFCNSVEGDAQDPTYLRGLINSHGFDSVINCIGVLNQFAEMDKARATLLNAWLPHFLVDITRDSSTHIIHLSTDCVFSGARGSYTEDDLRDGESYYDRSKALGELEDDKNITLRNSIVGPDRNINGIGLLNWFMKQTDSVKGYTGTIWTGLTTLELAKVVETAALTRAAGLYNMVYEEFISKYELLQLFNEYFRSYKIKIEAVEGPKLNKSLTRTRYEFDYKIPNYRQMVEEMAVWVRDHKELYPHYSL